MQTIQAMDYQWNSLNLFCTILDCHPEDCPPNSHCDDDTNGLCECDDGFHRVGAVCISGTLFLIVF